MQVRLCLHNRADPDPFGDPTMLELKQIRKRLGHNRRKHSRPKREPMVTPLLEIVWTHDDPSSDEDGISERGDGETDDDSENETQCRKKRQAEEATDGGDDLACESCNRTEWGDGAESMLLCDGCDRGFHCQCLDPPLDSVPKDAWWCPKCVHEDNEDDEPNNSDAFDGGRSSDDDADAEEELEQLRSAAQRVPREQLVEDRVFLCWSSPAQESFYPVRLREDVRKRARSISCTCLQPVAGRKGLYTIDPEQEVDEATLILVFSVPGEIFTEVPDGYKGQRAWMVTYGDTQ